MAVSFIPETVFFTGWGDASVRRERLLLLKNNRNEPVTVALAAPQTRRFTVSVPGRAVPLAYDGAGDEAIAAPHPTVLLPLEPMATLKLTCKLCLTDKDAELFDNFHDVLVCKILAGPSPSPMASTRVEIKAVRSADPSLPAPRVGEFHPPLEELGKCESLCSASLGNALAQRGGADGSSNAGQPPAAATFPRAVEQTGREGGGASLRAYPQVLPPLPLQDVGQYGPRVAGAGNSRLEDMRTGTVRADEDDPAAPSVDVYDTPYGPIFVMDGKPYDARGCEVQPSGAPLPVQAPAQRMPSGEVQVDSQGRRVFRVANASVGSTVPMPHNDSAGALPSLGPPGSDRSTKEGDPLGAGMGRQLSLGGPSAGGSSYRGTGMPAVATMMDHRGRVGPMAQGAMAERDQQGGADSSEDEGNYDVKAPVAIGGGYDGGAARGSASRRSSSSDDSDEIAAKIEAEYDQTVLRKAPKSKAPLAAASSSSSSSSTRHPGTNSQPASSISPAGGSRNGGSSQGTTQPRRASSQPALSAGSKPPSLGGVGSDAPGGGANAGGGITANSSKSASARPRPSSSSRQQQPAPSMPTAGFGRTSSQPTSGAAGRRAASVGNDSSVPQRASSSRSGLTSNKKAPGMEAPKPTAEMLKVMKSNWDNLM